jgi:hypothetical protein
VSWRFELARDAKKELARLPGAVQKRVARVLLSLENDPFPAGCEKLKNRDGWRVAWVIIEFFTSPIKLRAKSPWESSHIGVTFIADSRCDREHALGA